MAPAAHRGWVGGEAKPRQVSDIGAGLQGRRAAKVRTANPQSSCPGPLLCHCKRWEHLQASGDPAPCHPRQPVWLTDREGWHQDQGDPRGEGKGILPPEPHLRLQEGAWAHGSPSPAGL